MNGRTVLLVTEHNAWKVLVAPAALDLGYSLATCTWRGLERTLDRRPTGFAAVVAVPRDERDAFALLSTLRRSGRTEPVVLVTADDTVRDNLRELEPAARVVSPREVAEALEAIAAPVAAEAS